MYHHPTRIYYPHRSLQEGLGDGILKRALQGGREHDFSGRSPGPYDGPPSKETTEDLMIDGDEDSSSNAEDVEDDDKNTHQTNGDYLRFLPTLLRITDTRRTPFRTGIEAVITCQYPPKANWYQGSGVVQKISNEPRLWTMTWDRMDCTGYARRASVLGAGPRPRVHVAELQRARTSSSTAPCGRDAGWTDPTDRRARHMRCTEGGEKTGRSGGESSPAAAPMDRTAVGGARVVVRATLVGRKSVRSARKHNQNATGVDSTRLRAGAVEPLVHGTARHSAPPGSASLIFSNRGSLPIASGGGWVERAGRPILEQDKDRADESGLETQGRMEDGWPHTTRPCTVLRSQTAARARCRAAARGGCTSSNTVYVFWKRIGIALLSKARLHAVEEGVGGVRVLRGYRKKRCGRRWWGWSLLFDRRASKFNSPHPEYAAASTLGDSYSKNYPAEQVRKTRKIRITILKRVDEAPQSATGRRYGEKPGSVVSEYRPQTNGR
ncbi:hypothetical protein B0H14DRAFT_3134321 [Mycena olivaceomarginata]|nr:hypothetical protein B0H14DRAFT_3134321 [Mycena olivaceomarginata]